MLPAFSLKTAECDTSSNSCHILLIPISLVALGFGKQVAKFVTGTARRSADFILSVIFGRVVWCRPIEILFRYHFLVIKYVV